MNFHSDNYEYLVVDGSKAMCAGTGTINDMGNYEFMISAIDEKLTTSTDTDMFRIKIWNTTTVIYDNMLGAYDDADPTTEIQGGNIKIHKAK